MSNCPYHDICPEQDDDFCYEEWDLCSYLEGFLEELEKEEKTNEH
jgi:hypothetical protein